MKDRIRQLMEAQQLTQQNFAEKLNISPASLSSIFNDRTKPTLNHVDAIRKSFPNINLDWLLYGVGEMFVTPGGSSNDSVPSNSGSNPTDLALDFSEPQAAPLQVSDFQQSRQQSTYQQHKPEIQQGKIINKAERKIAEIRIFYDDQTWETFVPKK